mgnify:CR=1 FL=1
MINSCMNSETILSANTHPGGGTTETVTGDKFKGDGYYGRSDGLHTIQINLSGFLGDVQLQGTLAVDPTADDWFTVRLGSGQTIDTTGKIFNAITSKLEYTANETSSKTYNFTGNYVWIRAKISNWTDGTVNSIQMNH